MIIAINIYSLVTKKIMFLSFFKMYPQNIFKTLKRLNVFKM